MSLHRSLRVDSASAQQRTVLTRIERIKDLMKKGIWADDQEVTGLPKTKIVRVKAQKEKKVSEEETDETEKAAE
jgi:small basic protein (TIGR04137 family)